MQSAQNPKDALRDWLSKHCPGVLDTYHSLRTSILNRTLSAERTFEKIHDENLALLKFVWVTVPTGPGVDEAGCWCSRA